MTEKNYRPRPLSRPVEGVAPDPLEIAARALEGMRPATESWFTNPNLHAAPGQAPAPRYTPYAAQARNAQPHIGQPRIGQPRIGQIPGADGLPQRTPGASRATAPQMAPQAAPRRDASFFQPARPGHQRPAPAHAQPSPQTFRPTPYAMQQPQFAAAPARPMMYANPAMPSYAAAQAPAPKASFIDQGPEDRSRNKKAILLPLAAMAIASAAIGAFAQSNVAPDTGLQAQTQQVKAHSTQVDASPVIEYVGDQKVVGAPDIIAPDGTNPVAPVSPAVERATAGGKHSTGNYDAPSGAASYGGSHSSSGTVAAPSNDGGTSTGGSAGGGTGGGSSTGGDTSADPAPAPAPQPEPAPKPKPKRPTLGENVVAPTLDATTGVVGTLTGIKLDLTR